MIDALLAELEGPDRLATFYAPASVRQNFVALLALDRRLAAVLRKTSEPIIAQMRFAWWRDRLRDEPEKWPKGEPLFLALHQIARGKKHADTVENFGSLVDLWEELAVCDIWSDDVMTRFHANRARVLAVQLVEGQEVAALKEAAMTAAQGWSVLDLANQLPREVTLDSAWLQLNVVPSERLPRQLRALAILHRSAILSLEDRQGTRRNALLSSARLLWCGLTGR